MSYILDALRKSEQERRQAESLVLTQGPPVLELPRRRLAPWVAGASAAVVVFVAVIYWILLERRSEPTPPVSTMTASAPRAAEPVAAPPASIENRRVETPAPPELKPHPLAPANETPGARDLAAEAQVELRQPARPRRSAAVASTAPPTEIVANTTAPVTVKLLRTMPPDFQRSLPELTVNIHIYAPREVDRILYINNRQYHSGERVGDGIVVEEIVEDGAVLSFHGQRFKLPRPS